MSGAFMRRLHWIIVPLLLLASAGLAVSSLVGDSITFDETCHLAAGASYLHFGDFRISPDHPPLAKMWAAWPLLLTDLRWPSPDAASWQKADHYKWGEEFLFGLNAGHNLLVRGRCMMVVLLLATCATIYAAARKLFGPSAGLLSLFLAAFSPTLLAHGRLVTTDLPLALGGMLVLLSFAGLLQRMTWPRVLAAGLSSTFLCLTKFSWPLILVGPLAMMLVAIFRTQPMEIRLWPFRPAAAGGCTVSSRRRRLAAIGAAAIIIVIMVWAGIWSCYGWRYSMLATAPRQPGQAAPDPARAMYDRSWQAFLDSAEAGSFSYRIWDRTVAAARSARLLPEAYLYGFAFVYHTSATRTSYFMGRYSITGSPAYFPVAFAVKTPIPTQVLLVLGIVVLILRREPSGDRLLLIGMIVLGAVFAAAAICSHVNIGLRHILPLYPIVFILAGASARCLRRQEGVLLVSACAAWLVAANLRIYPQYISYFNGLAGGPANGYKFLADSNLDWGQDLIRLSAYLRDHKEEKVHFSYFGSVNPAKYGIRCEALPSNGPFDPPSGLTPGLYVVSVTQLLGVYDPGLRDDFWADPDKSSRYVWLCEVVRSLGRGNPRQQDAGEWPRIKAAYETGRRKRLVNRLKQRPPDDRVGFTLFVYHLSAADIEELTRP